MTLLRRLLPWVLVLLLLGWWSRGVWPVVPVEGDDQGVIFGVASMLREDPLLRQARYLYEVQPGSYHLLAALAKITGASAETVFGAATVTGALAFAWAGARLLQLCFAWPLPWLLVALLWCQEVTTAACYSNTSSLAGGLALMAVALAHRRNLAAWLGAGLLMALAGWLRADSLLVAPACLGLAYWREQRWKAALIETALIAAVTLAVVLLLYWMSGTSLVQGFGSYAQRGFDLSGWRTLVETFLLVLSPALMLGGAAGVLLLLRGRQFALGLVVLSGVGASVVAYGTSLTTPKYFYYLVPFALMPALHLASVLRPWAQQHPRLAAILLATLALGDGLLGIRTLDPTQRYFTTEPTCATLARADAATKHLALVIGPGELVFTADGFRLRTGQLFAPESWHREKRRMQADLATIRSWLAGGRDLTLYWSNWLPTQIIARELLAAGFRPWPAHNETNATASAGEWQRASQLVHVRYLGYVGSPYQPPGPAPASATGDQTYLVGDCANRPLTELADDRHWHLLSAVPEGLITLHQRL